MGRACYVRDTIANGRRPYELSSGLLRMYQAFGMDTSRNANLEYLDEKNSEPVIAYVAGNALVALSVPSMKRKYVFGIDRTGIGCFVVHPTRETLAVGETGRKLATVSGSPDFLLSIWDWDKEQMLLQSKAFGQEIYSVKFSSADDGRLTTAGTGHIRFWKMASTFTGLKLQGDIGKFGKVELTDIYSFVELPNNQVLSSTESGALLLWESNFIKYRIARTLSRPCHDSEVYFLAANIQTDTIISAGADGWVRYWDTPSILNAEVDSDESISLYLEPAHEIRATELSMPCSIRWMLRGSFGGHHYFIFDSCGKLWRMQVETNNRAPASCLTTQTATFHAGPIYALAVSPMDHFAATAGADGTVRCWDYIARNVLFMSTHDNPARCLCWAPSSLDPHCRTLMVGFADGVVRVLYRAATQWLRIQCFKPHNAAITSIAVSLNGKYVVTGCSEGTLFFVYTREFDLGKPQLPYVPAGFVRTGDSPVYSISWRVDSATLLAAKKNGLVIEIDCSSSPLEPKQQGTYELRIPINKLSVMRPLEATTPAEVPAAQHTRLVPAEKVEFDEKSCLRSQLSISCATYFEANGKTILAAFRELHGKIHVVDQDTNMIIESLHIGVNEAKLSSTVSFMNYDHHLSFIVSASNDGTVSLRYIDFENSIKLDCVVSQPHDADATVTGAFLSHDGKFLLTAASDGLFVVQQIRIDDLRVESDGEIHKGTGQFEPHEFITAALESENEPLPALNGFETIASDISRDIHDVAQETSYSQADDLGTNAYSFEDSRVKSEQDKFWDIGHRKKEVTRESLMQMRREFESLMFENSHQDREHQLRDTDLVPDADMIRLIESQGEVLLRDVCQECEHDGERSKDLLRKLKDSYVNRLEKQGTNIMEGQSLMSFLSKRRVGSFRIVQTTGQLRRILGQLHVTLRGEEASNHHSQTEVDARAEWSVESLKHVPSDVLCSEKKEDSFPEKESKGARISTVEARKQMRLTRQSELAIMSSQRPSEDTDDPRDVQAIQEAKHQLGDYRLKSGDAYEVSYKVQINTNRKRRQILLLQDNINSIKLRYNKRFFALREVKRLLTHSLAAATLLIRLLDDTFDSHKTLSGTSEFTLALGEWPDLARNLSGEDLVSFISCKHTDSEEVWPWGPSLNNKDSASNSMQTTADLPIFRHLKQRKKASVMSQKSSQFQIPEDICCTVRAGCSRHQLLSIVAGMNEHLCAFDNALNELRKEHIPLQADLKAAELRMLILLQELSLLKKSEAKDDALMTKLNRACGEKQEASTALVECSSKLAAKTSDKELWQNKIQVVFSEFNAAISDGDQFHAPLLKIFRRKIKKSKKQPDENDDEEEEDEDDDEDSQEEDEDDNDEDDSCPHGCDATLFERVLELREKRLALEVALTEILRAIDELQRNHDRHMQRKKQISRDAHSYQKEIRSFQTEKQQTLNKLYSTVALNIDQMHVFSAPALESCQPQPDVTCYRRATMITEPNLVISPKTDMGTSVLFSGARLRKLHNRIFELESINKTEKANFKELHRAKNRLERAKLALNAQITRLRSKCDDLQMLKFGQLIKLDVLDRDSKNNEGERALNMKINMINAVHASQLGKLNRRQSLLHDQLLQVTRQNTQYLAKIGVLSSDQYQLEKELNLTKAHSSGVSKGSQSVPMIRREIEERNRLVALVKLQAREIDALKVEINLLRRKGGHIYIPSLPADSNQNMAKNIPSVAGMSSLITPSLSIYVGATPEFDRNETE